MVLPQLRRAELCAKLFWGDVAPSAPAYPGDPQLGAVPAAAGIPGQAAVTVLRKFKEALGSHSVLIKYTGIVAAVAAPQILDPRSGSGAELNHLWEAGEAADGFLLICRVLQVQGWVVMEKV